MCWQKRGLANQLRRRDERDFIGDRRRTERHCSLNLFVCCRLRWCLQGLVGHGAPGLAILAPFQPLFLLIAVACLGAGFWLVYGKSKPICETDACVASSRGRFLKSVLLVKGVLWLGAMLVTLSLGVDFGARLF